MNQTREEQIQEVEITIEQARAFIELGEALKRLQKNPDFIKVVQEHYCTHEAARAVSLLAHPAQQRPEAQMAITHYLRGISEFTQFMVTLGNQTEQFRLNLEDAQGTLEELHEENNGIEDADGSDAE